MKPVAPAAQRHAPPIQKIDAIRRDYNSWVATESLEDYALRFTARSFRKWSEFRVANTAFGAISFLLLEAIGGSILVNYGFTNTLAAIVFASVVIFLTAWPISWYGAKYGVDMDLLTRGAGFGYLGSTITSLIYASFTFIFFALEASIMALALRLCFGWPMTPCYLLSALGVIPLVTHGITWISRLQAWTQPLWLILMALPFIFLIAKAPALVAEFPEFQGLAPRPPESEGHSFNMLMFGAASSVMLSMVTQVGEQIDFLRFLPERSAHNRYRWLGGVLVAGPGWIVLGALRMLGGALLAYVALRMAVPAAQAAEPAQMYLIGFRYVLDSPSLALAVTTLFVVMSQLKINVTNAYAGSLAWSNFFARVTHSHPGRVVWVVFNVLIALILMELDVFSALERVLGLYSNVAISWVGALVADLVINKPLGLSPKGIEFKRAHLYAINPVGVGAMAFASVVSISAYAGLLGEVLQAFSAFVALATAFIMAPLIAWATDGKYYIARPAEPLSDTHQHASQHATQHAPKHDNTASSQLHRCCICERAYEGEDMALCPAYRGPICSLCCSLDARCHDACKPGAGLTEQVTAAFSRWLPEALSSRLNTRLGRYVLLEASFTIALAVTLTLIYLQEAILLKSADPLTLEALRVVLWKIFGCGVAVSGIGCWWLVLTAESRRVAQQESERQTRLLMQEIEAHRKTDAALQAAKLAAERANQAKSRYVTSISHELRTPLNSILGYAQLLEFDPSIAPQRRHALEVIRRSGEHLVSLIDGLLDIAKIETGKLTLVQDSLRFKNLLTQWVEMFQLQAHTKGIDFIYEPEGKLPDVVRGDKKRLGQILINVLGNAIKFTEQGAVRLRVRHRNDIALFEIIDSGSGIAAEDIDRIFQPFERGLQGAASSATHNPHQAAARDYGASGTGLGLTIAQMLTTLMGGELTVSSQLGIGSCFQIRLFLPQIAETFSPITTVPIHIVGYSGPRKRILVVDNEAVDRQMLASVLQPLGFDIRTAASGIEALQLTPHVRPDLILLDIGMPGIDGWETARLLRDMPMTPIPILVVSADAFEQHHGADVGICATDFLVKPVNVSALLERIRDKLSLNWITRERSSLEELRTPSAASEAIPAANSATPAATPTTSIPSDQPTVLAHATEPEFSQLHLSREIVSQLRELGELGHIRGLLIALDAIELDDPQQARLIAGLRTHVEAFHLNDFLRALEQVSHADAH